MQLDHLDICALKHGILAQLERQPAYRWSLREIIAEHSLTPQETHLLIVRLVIDGMLHADDPSLDPELGVVEIVFRHMAEWRRLTNGERAISIHAAA